MKNCLSIAGSDCSGGAGIQADLKTFAAHGTYGMSVILSVVAENTSRVISIQDITAQIIKDQIDAVFEDIKVDAVKIGMLSCEETMKAAAEKMQEYAPENIVIDPVMIAKGGGVLMNPKALDFMKKEILPFAFVLTPNIPEAEALTGMAINNIDEMKTAAEAIHKMGAGNVLLKGGHLKEEASDILFDGERFELFTTERINTKNTHGTGCTLSSAIAANLAKEMDVIQAVKEAKNYVTEAIKQSLNIGKGNGPLGHFHKFFPENSIEAR